MRDKVLAVIEMYAEGGALQTARDHFSVKGMHFYACLRENPDLKDLYYEVQEFKADMMVDDAYATTLNEVTTEPKVARAKADILLKCAGLRDRKRFGEKVQIDIEAGPDLAAAIEAGRQRASRPLCNLGQVIDVESEPVQALTNERPADMLSVERSLPAVDPFED